jgi:hypothetical protein
LTGSGGGGIISINRNERGISDLGNSDIRQMPHGQRKSPLYTLTNDEIEALKKDIAAINADESVFIFNDKRVRGTSYIPALDIIVVKGNVFPDVNSTHPRDLMSARAVLAHEYYGHRPFGDTKLDIGDWRDEFRASYMAAKNSPGLSDEDRRLLILDAVERANSAGVAITQNDFMRGLLYG